MRAPLAAGLHRMGLSVLLVDYRGYGDSTGAPSEKGRARGQLLEGVRASAGENCYAARHRRDPRRSAP